jgi:CRISPR system Cascade subunit CasD
VAEFLTFALIAPIASFGAIAVGERRPGWDRPARSAILGLVGACLGVERGDDAGQRALAADYGVAVLCHAPGRLLADYHTIQVPPSGRNRRYATRAAELASPDLATILTRRDYRTGAWHLAALWSRGSAPRWSLTCLEAAMQTPEFTPYLGRKSCPLGLPLAPARDEAPDPATALSRRYDTGPESRFRSKYFADPAGEIIVARDHWGEDTGNRIEFRRDQPRSRRLWQFDLREEVVENLPQREAQA